ncbi:MAG: BMP family ABC transporter substrate-binding protein [Candidatus Eisenbacteria bacterium]|uniref:BMP family ABC transporter substrate-binding protein n=1 Tax=Eiseniibacteriota bacterium TaxID=2212470 RepID=A0A948RYN0_UNCEI|nr:BMP family ABC transporter substrate-binding protein [Candidatus Eisenbacteria bacterium]MBU1947951.1 BMP family ABC transporter substrate-binding protein [Candidatus Eisenbacteria bacterium]MBU2693425.1 BMP family ABC transporter substrate-binding protein [Candidatus Eisenbacteria bacterium]
MKRWAMGFLTAGLVLSVLGCGGDSKKAVESKIHVGLVFDVGGLGDKSFNDSAHQGLLRARDELGVSFVYLEPGEGSDREEALRMMATGDADIIFGIGFLFTDDITNVANEFPDKKFACVDYAVKDDSPLPENLAAIKFREEEGSFLAGALAAMVSKTDAVGFIGGMEGALIRKFEKGFAAGARHIRPGIRVLVNYAGVTGAAFKNPSMGKELALAQYDSGADIIFHASGGTGLGVFEAARSRDLLAIGVDSDQWGEAPGHVLTSVLKRVDVAVFKVIQRTLNDDFPQGIQIFGLADGAVSLVIDKNNRQWITPEVEQRLRALENEIVKGIIKVPSS